ncbi:DUF1549 domain-containing protein [Planctomicrobium sp. SH668]|uniref:DUF1549 domain-containing protein n=1 Tax=Planctomicrobium sp. SH668 TaxID=3448126 RepID=UPI003F5BAEB2
MNCWCDVAMRMMSDIFLTCPKAIRSRTRTVIVLCLAWIYSALPVEAQVINSVQQRTCKAGQTTQLTIQGTDLNDSLRILVSSPAVQSKIEKIEPTQATVTLTLAEDSPPGPMSIWLTTATGAVKSHLLYVDDLDAVADQGNNHTRETAQQLSTHSSVEGVCNASLSDFYRFHADAGQRIAVEVHTQQLRSTMDPVVRLLNAAGQSLIQADDSPVGPDCSFSYQIEKAGDYWIEVLDSRHGANGAPYQLRIGNFPVVHHCFPIAIKRGEKANIRFIGPDGPMLMPQEFAVGTAPQVRDRVRVRFAPGQPASWLPLIRSSQTQVIEPVASDVLTLPIGINGRFKEPQEIDSYLIHGTKGQSVHFSTVTRSVGSPTILQMRLFNSAGTRIAESKVSESDESTFTTTFPEDGDYRLEVADLLKRGGDQFNYYIECVPAGTFAISFKPVASTREDFLIEPGHGACALELQIQRFGYDGEIDLALSVPDSGLRLLNPRIPANANEAKIYLAADPKWKAENANVLQLTATSVTNPELQCVVDSRALRRVKEPSILAPVDRVEGEIVLSSGAGTPSPFELATTEPIEFARPIRSHSAVLTLKRIQENFKAGVDILPDQFPAGWGVSTQVEQDKYTLNFTRGDQATVEPEQLQLLVFGELDGRGRIETCRVPVQWIDPVRVTLSFPAPLVRGGQASAELKLQRSGSDPQPVTITVDQLPAGITGLSPITIAADQNSAVMTFEIAADAVLDLKREFTVRATSKFAAQEFTVSSAHELPLLTDSPASVVVHPSQISFDDPRGRQQLAITGIDAQDGMRDWTRTARISSSNPLIAEVRNGVVYPVADGETEVVVEVGHARSVVPVRVTNRTTFRKLGFESEVLVALSKQGCNAGACHGSPSGKGGFRLSLRAFDMKLDEHTLIHEEFGRRVNTLEPEESLLLLKPLMSVSHGGGKQMRKSDVAYAILQDWISTGATADPEGTPRIVKIEIYPSQKRILKVQNGGVQFAVTAHLADGRKRDVTHLAAYETSDTSVATVSVNGFVTPQARGEVAILVRVLEYIESVPLMFVENQEGFEWRAPTPNNYVDELVYAKLKQLQYQPADRCSDDEFLRRVNLDLLGILPTPEQTTVFLSDNSPDKRERLIDSLLQREEFAKFWALKWGDLLKLTSKLVGDDGVYKYHRWIENSLHTNMPYDEFAKQLLTGTGSTLANPPANFYRTSTDMNECVETISQVFLGARLQCAKCHNHPFERWTQDNYYGLGAFFNRVQRRNTERPGEAFVYTNSEGDVVQPRTGQVMAPWLPQAGTVESPGDGDRRGIFAEWLVDENNPYFARIEANRIWSQLFARGIVDPIDDFRDSNPPSNAALLDALAEDFVKSGYDRKHLLRVILNSQTYQASCETTKFNESDSRYFSHQEPRLLTAEQLLDAINRTLAIEQKFGTLPAGTLATQLPAPDLVKVDFLKVFGQPERSTVCACERVDDSNLGMAIELFNGPLLHEKLRDANNRFRTSLGSGKTVEETIREIYLAALCRFPTEIELKIAVEHCSKNSDPIVGVEDICWALFNTDEFLFQH